MKASRSPKSPVAERCERRREAILARALLLFARDGFADLDLQILADDLGVGKGALCRYFPSKQELFLAAADRVMRDLRRHINTSVEGISDPLEQITRAIRAYLEH